MIGELSREESIELLQNEQLGRIGCCVGDRTYIVPVSYVYEAGSIHVLSAEGTKLTMMRQNPHVCFEVEHIERWYNWRTVIAWGTFEELAGDDADHAYRLIHSRLTPLIEFEAGAAQGLTQPRLGNREDFVLYRIRLEEISGRFERL